MSVHKKLMQARVMLQSREMKKSGYNKFAGYTYFELGDFLPHIQSIFNEIGLCGVISFDSDIATLTIIDSDGGSNLTLTCPMSSASLKGCHDVQNLGAVMTYIRRYLWTTALEIVEHDVLDATTGSEPPAKPVRQAKPDPVKAAPVAATSALQITVPDDVSDWVQAAIDATHVVLDFATTAEEVMEIYKINRTVYDRLKRDDPNAYESLMQLFKTIKENFAK